MTHTPGAMRAAKALQSTSFEDCGDEAAEYRKAAEIISRETGDAELLAMLERAQEELRLIQMKDCGNIYDVGMRAGMSALIAKAKGGAE